MSEKRPNSGHFFTRREFGEYVASENDMPAETGMQVAEAVAETGNLPLAAPEEIWMQVFALWEAAGGWNDIAPWTSTKESDR
jgi:hypothetical protein